MKKIFITLIFAGLVMTACTSEEEKLLEQKTVEQDQFVAGSEADFLNFIDYKDKVYFRTDSTSLSDWKESFMILDMQIAWLQENPNKHIIIEGYCDKRASREYNVKLGHARAKAVAKYMIREGIDSTRIATYSQGEFQADQNCTSEKCYWKDRYALTRLNVVRIRINEEEKNEANK